MSLSRSGKILLLFKGEENKRTPNANLTCVSKSWNQACHRILSKPKLASAFSLDPDEKGFWVFLEEPRMIIYLV
ncbi:hypothetical protein NC652_029912 [Populus alba x Populus x berolinensis]|nr:hypothetical protein NC652_029908 [Populus alba x Populus x berolinensis]KAJ6888962.1 hypothetical protein NC652_029912 [Populus alba x Populus x berolinensis]